MAKKFTDNLLAQYQLSLVKDYQRLKAQGKEFQYISEFLREKFQMNVKYNDESSLYNLPEEEYQKALTVLNTFIIAVAPKQTNLESIFKPIRWVIINVNRDGHRHCCCPNDNLWFNWYMLHSLTYHHHLGADAIAVGGSHSHGYGNAFNGTGDKDEANLWLFLLLLLLATLAIILTLIALAYLVKEFFDSMERLWNNEGIWQAMVSMLSALAFGAASSWLTAFFLAAPITALAVAAGVNPVGMVILGVVCLTFIGAGAGCFITNSLQNWLIKINNPDALDPHDLRFSLTEAQEDNLRKQDLDPVKVKSAICFLRQKQGKDKLPSYLGRLFDSEKQEIIDQVRQLRRGELRDIDIKIGDLDLHINLRRNLHINSRRREQQSDLGSNPYTQESPVPPPTFYPTSAEQPIPYQGMPFQGAYPQSHVPPTGHSQQAFLPTTPSAPPPEYLYNISGAPQPTQDPYYMPSDQSPYRNSLGGS